MPVSRSGRAGVVAEGVHHHAHLAARVADRLAGVARLERGQLLTCASSASASRCSSRAALGGRDARATPGTPPARAPPRRRSPPRPRRGTSAITSAVAGSITWIIGPPLPPRLGPRSTSERDHPAALVLLGVPEHAEHVAVGRAARSPRAARRRVARPVTRSPSPSSSMPWWWCDFTALDSAPTARAASDPGSRRTSWSENVPGTARWSLVAHGVGHVLLERAAERHVQHLHPAADPEQRDVALERPVGQRRARSGRARARCPRSPACGPGAVGARIHVGAAGQHQPVDQVERLVGLLRGGVVGRQQHAKPAGGLHGVRVGARREVAEHLPGPPADDLRGAADADYGTAHYAQRTGRAHRRSKPRNFSQSVTAASKASSSTFARFR